MNSKIDTILVVIMSPEAIVFKDEALSLSSTNSEGPFDVLPDHARFMTLIEKSPMIVYLKNGSQKEIPLEHAVLFFQDNKVTIYIHTVG